MLKRETLFTSYTAAQTSRVRELVSYRARIATIIDLVATEYVELAARKMYEVAGQRPPGGTQSPCSQVLGVYRSLTNRLALNTMYNEFTDLRGGGFCFEDGLISAYRAYRKRIGWARDDGQVITFDHWYVVARELETSQSRLLRCSACGSRNLLTKHVSISSLDCVFCDLLESAVKKAAPNRASWTGANQKLA